MRRVVITGVGVISPIGNDRSTFWNNLIAGKSGVGPITQFDPSDYPVRIAAEVKDLSFGFLDRKEARHGSLRSVRRGRVRMALDSGLDMSKEDPDRVAIHRVRDRRIVHLGGAAPILLKGSKRVSPFHPDDDRQHGRRTVSIATE